MSNRRQAETGSSAGASVSLSDDDRRRAKGAPQPIGAFFGRAYDIQQVGGMLGAPAYQLVTLFGPGGIGKTRLAQEIAQARQADFADGVYLIPLQPVVTPTLLVTAILEGVGCPLRGTDAPMTQLLHYLADKQLLLVLDNFEHLLAAVDTLVAIMADAPQVKLLVTSREVLNLAQEWVWPVAGLAYPDSSEGEADDSAQDFAAVQLFADAARRVQPDFSAEQHLPAVVRICRLVEGVPLAIQLAASWLRSLSVAEIDEEIRRDFDILTTRLRDVPDQHRSIRTVFDRSWARLTPMEQRGLARLSVFRSSFSRAAAQYVADVPIMVLTALIDKSLLHHNQVGRYQLHELLRQYALQKLELEVGQRANAEAALGAFFRNFLAQFHPSVNGADQETVTTTALVELDNLRAAWPLLFDRADVLGLRKSLIVASHLFQVKGYYSEAQRLLTQILAQVEAARGDAIDRELLALSAEVRVHLSWMAIRLGEIDQAVAVLQPAKAHVERYDLAPLAAMGLMPHIPLAIAMTIQGRHNEAAALASFAAERSRARGDAPNLLVALYALTSAQIALGEYADAAKSGREATAVARRSGNRYMAVYCLIREGDVARAQGDHRLAQRYYEESFGLREAFEDPGGLVEPLTYLGQIALLQADFDRALSFFHQGREISEKIGDKGRLSFSLEGLGATYLAQRDLAQAHIYLNAALQVVTETQLPLVTLRVLNTLGRFLIETGAAEEGVALLSLVRHHPLGEQSSRDEAEEALIQYRSELPAAAYAAAAARGRERQLDAVLIDLKHTFPHYTWRAETARPTLPTEQPLVEPLTERELEVLRLLGVGLTNDQIAQCLIVVVGTVKTHNHNIFGKLGVRNRVQAIKRAQELNLL